MENTQIAIVFENCAPKTLHDGGSGVDEGGISVEGRQI